MGILKLSEKGVLLSIQKKWFTLNNTNCPTVSTGDKESLKLNMESLGGLFLVLIAGLLVAFIIGIAEFVWRIHRNAIKQGVSS